MAEPSLVFLIGYMGSGKTTTGKLLAKKLGYRFVDLDDLIEATSGLAIPVIFELKGEEHFRSLEQEMLHSLGDKKELIVSTGGGCAAYSDNMGWMNAHGTTVYLRCHPGKIFHRIAPGKQKRPMIAGLEDVDIMEFILDSIKKRLPYYVQAQFTVNGDLAIEQVAEEIKEKIKHLLTNSSRD